MQGEIRIMDKELKKLLNNYVNVIHGKAFPINPTTHQLHLLLDYIANLEQQCKKQKEVIDKIMNLIKQYGKYDGEKCTRGFQMWSADFNKILDMLKEVSE